jgi:hypothetical protein
VREFRDLHESLNSDTSLGFGASLRFTASDECDSTSCCEQDERRHAVARQKQTEARAAKADNANPTHARHSEPGSLDHHDLDIDTLRLLLKLRIDAHTVRRAGAVTTRDPPS